MLGFGRQRDPVAAQLRELERQGRILSALAHGCAFLLIVLFSLGSLIALSADALTRFFAHPNPLDGISLAVSMLLVVCMDLGMLYGAAMLRILRSRGATRHDMWVHVAMMAIACVLEAGTYAYMGYLLDNPGSNPVVWALISLRSLGSPLFAVYLSMAHTLPVTPRDILHHVEIGSGKELIRDTTRMAQDPDVPLVRKAEVFGAAADMRDADRARLDQLVGVLTPQVGPVKHARKRRVVVRPVSVTNVTALPAPDTAHYRIAALLRATPSMGVTELARRAQVSRSTAKRWKKRLAS